MPGFNDHFGMVNQISRETGVSPDCIDTAVRAFFGLHGIQHFVGDKLQKVKVKGLGEFKPSKKLVKAKKLHAQQVKENRLDMKRAANRRAAKKFYNKNKQNGNSEIN